MGRSSPQAVQATGGLAGKENGYNKLTQIQSHKQHKPQWSHELDMSTHIKPFYTSKHSANKSSM
eukprot:5776120-Amphidinium_carterae.6